ncbi:hypothetical protein H5410_047096 [Solanum commersonii]|uniref:Gag-pol polyprotein n=1 Tax=Solanum commersonii TaxID=4109 RepID=A0A9J5XHN0_SOLCO|nr:hypothetical protein H5410_047096 [Solanum commersonii]
MNRQSSKEQALQVSSNYHSSKGGGCGGGRWNKNSIGEQIPVYLDGENNEKAIQPQHQVPAVAQGVNSGCSETSPVMDEQIETLANCRAPRVRRRPSWMTDYESASSNLQILQAQSLKDKISREDLKKGIMPPRRVVRGRLARINDDPQDQGGEVTNAEFWAAIRMLSQVVANQAGQQRGFLRDVADTSRIRESNFIEDQENFVDELQKVFEVIRIVDAERVELVAYQLKGTPRIWYDQWKNRGVEGAPLLSWRDGGKYEEYDESIYVWVVALVKLMIHVQQVEKDKLKDREEYRNKRTKTACHESRRQQKIKNVNRSYYQQSLTRPSPSSSSEPTPKNMGYFRNQNSQNSKARPTQSQGSVAQGANWTSTCAKCSRNHPKACHDHSNVNGNEGNKAQSSLVAPVDRVVPRGATSGKGIRENLLYAITSLQEQENSQDVVTGMINVFTFYVYALLDPALQCFHTYWCVVSVNHKDNMTDLVELDMVDFNVILEWRSSSTVPKGRFISYIKARKLVSKGCIYNLVRFNDFSVKTPPIQSVPVVSEFPESLLREIDFRINILSDAQPISIPPYRMASTKLKELKYHLKDLLDKGFIRPSASRWGTSILFVREKDSSLRMFIDYR